MCHDHASAAVPLAAELVHGVSVAPRQLVMENILSRAPGFLTHQARSGRSAPGSAPRDLLSPVSRSVVLPGARRKDPTNLPAGEAPNGNNHSGCPVVPFVECVIEDRKPESMQRF